METTLLPCQLYRGARRAKCICLTPECPACQAEGGAPEDTGRMGTPHPQGPEDKALSLGELLVGGNLGPSSWDSLIVREASDKAIRGQGSALEAPSIWAGGASERTPSKSSEEGGALYAQFRTTGGYGEAAAGLRGDLCWHPTETPQPAPLEQGSLPHPEVGPAPDPSWQPGQPMTRLPGKTVWKWSLTKMESSGSTLDFPQIHPNKV